MKLTKLLGYMTAAAVGNAVLTNMADIKGISAYTANRDAHAPLTELESAN
jgi:hypothetical protein